MHFIVRIVRCSYKKYRLYDYSHYTLGPAARLGAQN